MENNFAEMLEYIAAIPENKRNIERTDLPYLAESYEARATQGFFLVAQQQPFFSSPNARDEFTLQGAKLRDPDNPYQRFYIDKAIRESNYVKIKQNSFGLSEAAVAKEIQEILKEPDAQKFFKEFDSVYSKVTPLARKSFELQAEKNTLNRQYNELSSELNEMIDQRGSIDPAPFVQDTKAWTELAIKRVARYAVDKGFDKVAFANGLQVTRVNYPGEQFEEVAINRSEDGNFYRIDALPSIDNLEDSVMIADKVLEKI